MCELNVDSCSRHILKQNATRMIYEYIASHDVLVVTVLQFCT